MVTNVAIALLVATLIWLVGVNSFLIVQLPITLLAASIGVWLFYVQHQFEERSGLMTRVGIFTKPGYTAVRIMTCQLSCAGLPLISAYTTSIIYAAGFLIIDCHRRFGITRSFLLSDD